MKVSTVTTSIPGDDGHNDRVLIAGATNKFKTTDNGFALPVVVISLDPLDDQYYAKVTDVEHEVGDAQQMILVSIKGHMVDHRNYSTKANNPFAKVEEYEAKPLVLIERKEVFLKIDPGQRLTLCDYGEMMTLRPGN